MIEWYRRKTWTKTDEGEFFAKLGRARKTGRAQYLRIQAIELMETDDKELLSVAEMLLNKILTDFPDDRMERSQVYNKLGEIYSFKADYDRALTFFKKSIDFEKEFPRVKTSALINYCETAVRTNKTALYGDIALLLDEEMKQDAFGFPIQNYIIYSVLAIISDHNGDMNAAKNYADLASKNAIADKNTLWNRQKQKLGLVKERKTWLDDLTGLK